MSKEQHPCDWAAYYKAAYKKEVKQNSVLAGKLSDAEAQAMDLTFRIERIQNNPFWKLYVITNRGYHAVGRRIKNFSKGHQEEQHDKQHSELLQNNDVDVTDVRMREAALECIREYEEERFRQKHPYLQMIGQWEHKTNTFTSTNDSFVDGWRVIELSDGDLCVVIFGKGCVDLDIEEKIKSWFNTNDECLFAYADEDYYWIDLGNRMHPWFKPDYSPDTLLSFNYLGHLVVARKNLVTAVMEQMGQKTPENSTYADFYEFCFRLEELVQEQKKRIGHIEEVLFHNCYEPDQKGNAAVEQARATGGDVLETVEKLLQEELEQGYGMEGCGASYTEVRTAALKRRGIRAHLEQGLWQDVYSVVYDLKPESEKYEQESMYKNAIPTVSVVIPSKDHPEILEQCLSSFCEKTEYNSEQYEFIVVDNGSNTDNKKKIEYLQQKYGFYYIYQPMEFNFSAMCNMGVAQAKGEYILLLNDDIEIIQKDWLRVMVGQAMQPHVGAVGAKLWYAGGESIQHAGITNLDIGPSHKLITFSDDRNYYYGHNQVTYDMIGVTAACLLVKKSKYEEVGGLDESMKVAYNDVDFCFKLIEAGYYNVLRNDAVLQHHESLSRGLDEEDDGKWDRLLREKENLYTKHPQMKNTDVFYHKNLIDNASNYTCNFKFDYENNLKETEFCVENAGQLAETCQNVMQFTVDRAEKQHKIHREEPDIMHIMGWSYIPGEDNAKFQRNIVLQREEGIFYKVTLFPWSRKDVEAILPHENNISLAGFVVRIRKENLQNGDWRIGMMATDLESGKRLLTWSEKTLEVR